MFGGAEINAGDGSKNVIGDGNDLRTIVLNAPQPAIHRNYLYDVSKKIIEADIKSSDDYSLESNAAWSRKLDHNNVSVPIVFVLPSPALILPLILLMVLALFTDKTTEIIERTDATMPSTVFTVSIYPPLLPL